MGRALLLVCLLAADAFAEPPRRWVYRAAATDDSGKKGKPVKLVLVETGRRTLAGRDVLDLAVEVNGEPASADDIRELGFSSAPFTTLAPRWSLLTAKDGSVALVEGDEPLAEKDLKEALRGATTWKPRDAKRKRPKDEPGDRPFRYGKKVHKWPSICEGYLHPSPDTGDTFESERCYAPDVGVTLLSFDSVWGGFQIELTGPPPQP